MKLEIHGSRSEMRNVSLSVRQPLSPESHPAFFAAVGAAAAKYAVNCIVQDDHPHNEYGFDEDRAREILREIVTPDERILRPRSRNVISDGAVPVAFALNEERDGWVAVIESHSVGFRPLSPETHREFFAAVMQAATQYDVDCIVLDARLYSDLEPDQVLYEHVSPHQRLLKKYRRGKTPGGGGGG